MAVIETVQLNL